MTAKELWKARALYIGHLLAWGVLYGIAYFVIGKDLLKDGMEFSDWLAYAGFILITFFILDLLLAPIFKRKARVWEFRMSRPHEDRWPRADSRRRP